MVDILKALQNHDDAPDASPAGQDLPVAEGEAITTTEEVEEIDDADLLAAADLEMERMAAERRAQEAGLMSQNAAPAPLPVRAPRKKKVRPEGFELPLSAPLAAVVVGSPAKTSPPIPAPVVETPSLPAAAAAPAEVSPKEGNKMPEKKTDFVPIKAVDGIRLDEPQGVVTQTPKSRQLQDILTGTAPNPKTTAQIVTETGMMNPMQVQAIITRGDDPLSLEAAPEEKETLEKKLTRLGFPPRPANWPVFIDWPPREVAEKFADPAVTEEQRQKMIRLMLSLEEAAIRRARQVNEWLNETNPPIPPKFFKFDAESRMMRRNLRILRETQDDPHHSIRWATLINPMSQNQALLNSVVTWSQTSATTLDGGQVLVDKDSISFSGGSRATLPYSPQAIALGIQEAKNRGWKSLKMSGSFEFGQLAIKAAREAGIEAEITFYGKGLGSWTKHTVKVSPNVPFVDNDITELMNAAMGDPVTSGAGAGGPVRHVPVQNESPFASRRSGQQTPSLPDHDPRGDEPPFDPSHR